MNDKSDSNWTSHNEACNRLANAVRITKRNFEYKHVIQVCDNMKAIWKHVISTQKR